MGMIQHNVMQGSQEWLDLRQNYLTASEAPVIMGCHPNVTRDELLEAKATCNPKEYSRFVEERVFAKGHETEAAARPFVEEMIGEELYPVTATNGRFLASYDGLTLMNETGFEHKQWNAELATLVEAWKPPAYIVWQLEQQLMVCPDLEKIVLVVSDGTRDNFVSMEYHAVPGRREQLLAGWEQFEKDLAEFQPGVKTVEAVGRKPASLPMLLVEVSGSLVTSDNIAEFRAGAEQLIASIKTELVTDQDFADAEQMVKHLKEAEDRIDMLKDQMLGKTGKLSDLLATLDDIQANMMRTTRLKLDKQVQAQKVNRRNQIVADAERAFDKFFDDVGREFAPHGVRIVTTFGSFYDTIKGKRSFDLMVSACNDEIARRKMQVNEIAAKARANLATLDQHSDYHFLFANKQQLAFMEPDHLALTIKTKISDYRAEQERTETARKQRHQNTIDGIVAAGDFDDSMPYAALVVTRQRINQIDTSGMQEFAIKADQAKVATLTKLDERLKVLREQEIEAERRRKQEDEQRQAQARAQQAAMPAVDTIPGLDDLDDDEPTIHAGEQTAGTVYRDAEIRAAIQLDKRDELAERVRTALNEWKLTKQVRDLLVEVREHLEAPC